MEQLPAYERDQITIAVDRLDRLCVEEYGYGLIDLLANEDEEVAARRLRRLTGITLKADFATPHPIGTRPSDSGARRYWTWNEGVADGLVDDTSNPNFLVLDQLRQELPDLDPSFEWRQRTWADLLEEAEHESGLFRVLVHWVDDKLRKRPTRSFRTYYLGEPSTKLGTVADVVETVFNHFTAPVFAAFIPGPGLVVPLVLIGVRFGLTRMLEASVERDDQN